PPPCPDTETAPLPAPRNPTHAPAPHPRPLGPAPRTHRQPPRRTTTLDAHPALHRRLVEARPKTTRTPKNRPHTLTHLMAADGLKPDRKPPQCPNGRSDTAPPRSYTPPEARRRSGLAAGRTPSQGEFSPVRDR